MPDPIWHDWQHKSPPYGVRIVCERAPPYYERFTVEDVRTVHPMFNIAGVKWRRATEHDRETPDAH